MFLQPVPIPKASKPKRKPTREKTKYSKNQLANSIDVSALRKLVLQQKQLQLDINNGGRILLNTDNDGEFGNSYDDNLDNPGFLAFYSITSPENPEGTLEGCIRLPRASFTRGYAFQESLLPASGATINFRMDSRPDITYKGIMLDVTYFGKKAGKRMATFSVTDVSVVQD